MLTETLDDDTWRHLSEKLAHEKARQVLEKK
jgi:hypothetical protein